MKKHSTAPASTSTRILPPVSTVPASTDWCLLR